MKHLKKAFALLLVAMMVLALGTSAFAVDISIDQDTTNIDPTAIQYTYYKIFDATYVSNTTTDATIAAQADTKGFSYTIPANSPLLTVSGGVASIDGITNITLTENAAGDAYFVTFNGAMSEDAAKSMAAALQTKINGLTDAQKATLAFGDVAWDTAADKYTAAGLDAGYYLIESNSNTRLILATSDIAISEKNTYPTVTKTIRPIDESVQIGDIIPFTLTVPVPAGANQQIVITDTYEAGLTPQVAQTTDSAAAYYSTSQTAGQVYVTATVDGAANEAFTVSAPADGKFTITLTAAQVTALAGKTIVFTYDAELNANAEVRDTNESDVTNDNTVGLKYGSDFDATPSSVSITTQTITLTKYDGSDRTKAPIAGAIFELQADGAAVKLVKVSDTEYRVATASEIAAYNSGTATAFTDETTAMDNGAVTTNIRTVAGTVITVKGLDVDVSYTWAETKAPTGYNPTTENADVTPTKTGVVNTEVVNNKGSVLPSTGGIGTTIFYVVGGILVVAAGVVLITRKRVGKEN